jgi:hypothetical protein
VFDVVEGNESAPAPAPQLERKKEKSVLRSAQHKEGRMKRATCRRSETGEQGTVGGEGA